MSTKSPLTFILCAAMLSLGGAVGCVTSDVDVPDDSDNMSNGGAAAGTGGATDTGGSGTSGSGPGGATSEGGAAGAPASPAKFRCEDPNGPKITAAQDDPLIVDFELGSFSLTTPSDFAFTGAANGGTYTYQETGTQAMLEASLAEDRNGGRALSVILSNSTDYGGGMGLYFFPCVDASGYSGFTFFARGNLPERTVAGAPVPAGTVIMNLDIADVAVNSLDTIGCAMDTPADATVCARPTTTFVVSDVWEQFTFTWDDFDPGNKNGTPFNPTGDNLLGINLAMDNAFGTPNDLELVIDDVAFVP